LEKNITNLRSQIVFVKLVQPGNNFREVENISWVDRLGSTHLGRSCQQKTCSISETGQDRTKVTIDDQ